MEGRLYGIVGGIGSGKDTVAKYLIEKRGFKRESFSQALKDIVSIIFNWDRGLLEGLTEESRAFREQVDEWWSTRLNIPNLTPRMVLQQFGTEVCRDAFHNDIWLANLETRLLNSKDDIVISDCRFENEIKSLHKMGAKIIHVTRGPEPNWKNDAILAGIGDNDAINRLTDLGIHNSEWGRYILPVDYFVENDGSLEDLYLKLENIIY